MDTSLANSMALNSKLGSNSTTTLQGVIFPATQKTINNPQADILRVPYIIQQLHPGKQIRPSEGLTIRQEMTQTCVPENIERVKSSLTKSDSANKENVKHKNNLIQKVARAAFTFLILLDFCFLIHSVNANVLEPIAQSSTDPLKHFIVFDEVGQLASIMTYIHVQIRVNLTSIYQQAEVMRRHFIILLLTPY
jgi:hypothetical protein